VLFVRDFLVFTLWRANRLRSPQPFRDIVHRHYDLYRHESSGPHILVDEWFYKYQIQSWYIMTLYRHENLFQACSTEFCCSFIFDLRFRAVSVFHMHLCLSGLPLEILAQEFWVPNSTLRAEHPKFQQKEIFQDILTCTDDTACLYALRACQDRVYSACCPVFFLKLDSCCRAPHPFLFAGLCTPCQPRSFNQGEGRGWPRIS